MLAVVILLALIAIPCFAMVMLCIKFDYYTNKESKKTLGTLMLKIYKTKRVRVISPIYFFFRRLWTAYMIILSLRPSAELAYVQFTSIITFSALYLLYLLQFRPYSSK
jgi:hypothetical protein